MMFGYLTLATALIISLSAAVYSILGLTAIFAAAFWPIVIMGGSLEVGKIVTTLWLHKYWNRAELQYKVYLCSAVAILMLLTSMGVFGFLSKAHTDQGLVSGDVTSKIAIYDEKIKIEKDNIDANRKALKQMDEAVDQVMARSTSEGGADKAVAIRRSQQKERSRILAEIGESQKKITSFNEQRAPIAAEVRKVEAEVGPIKYIAALIYGDNPDANVLEKAVRWVIILIVVVFDPLALTLLLAATKTFEWERGIDVFNIKRRDEKEYGEELVDSITEDNLHEPVWDRQDPTDLYRAMSAEGAQPLTAEQDAEDALYDEYYNNHPAVKKSRWAGFSMPFGSMFQKKKEEPKQLESVEDLVIDDGMDERPGDYLHKVAERAWKVENPDKTLKEQRKLFESGKIDHLPWEDPDFIAQLGLEADNQPSGIQGNMRGFGIQFPDPAQKGDMFLMVDRLPTALFKYNGQKWIEIPKTTSDSYAYDEAYIDHLIQKISTGEYDPELLSDAERAHIEERLQTPK